MKTFTAAAVAVAASLLLASCSAISSGRITDKNYSGPYSYVTYQCTAYRSNGTCMINMPVTHHVEERFSFDIEDGKDTGWVNVNKYDFESYEVGDWYEGD